MRSLYGGYSLGKLFCIFLLCLSIQSTQKTTPPINLIANVWHKENTLQNLHTDCF